MKKPVAPVIIEAGSLGHGKRCRSFPEEWINRRKVIHMNWNNPEEVAKERARLARNVEEAEKKYNKYVKTSLWLHRFVVTTLVLSLVLALFLTLLKLME